MLEHAGDFACVCWGLGGGGVGGGGSCQVFNFWLNHHDSERHGGERLLGGGGVWLMGPAVAAVCGGGVL